jgi:hypothetical protein
VLYRTIILPVVLYGCETWSLTLREACRLRMFKNRVLRRIFQPKKDDVAGKWRRLHNEQLYDLYSSPNIIWVNKSRIMRWAGHVVCRGDRRGVHRVLVGVQKKERSLGKPRQRWGDCINMAKCDGRGDIDLIDLAQDRDCRQNLLIVVMNIWVPLIVGNFLTLIHKVI